MGRFDDAYVLIATAEGALPNIETRYNKSLASREIDPSLPVQIKNVLENLRSALDYIAKELFERFCTKGKGNLGGFPVVRQQQDWAARVNGMLPGLSQSRQDLCKQLESYQPYSSRDNKWLEKFNDLCQLNKHEQFSPQTRQEQRGKRLTDDQGRSVSWSDGVRFGPKGTIGFRKGGKLVFGPGGSVGIGQNGVSVLGRQVNPNTQTPAIRSGDKLEHMIWVDFRFDTIDESALPFLRTCTQKVRSIVGELERAIVKT